MTFTEAISGSAVGTGQRSRHSILGWSIIIVVSGLLLTVFRDVSWVYQYPTAWTLPIPAWISLFMDWFVENFRWLFRSISWLLTWPMIGLNSLIHWLPWSVTVALLTLVAWQGAGRNLAIFSILMWMFILIVGYWTPTMNTLVLVSVAIPLAVGIGFALGVWSFRSARVNAVVEPTLDLMQTVPAFAYLIPILMLFGFGPVVGLIASVIFSIPPMVRNTILGFRLIPESIVESGTMSGCSARQQFWRTEVPTALPQMLIGVNQTTMCALSMVIIAAIIGGFDDIGWAVLSTMRKAQFGQSVISGSVIVLLAVLFDRVTHGFAERSMPTAGHVGFSLRVFCYCAVGLPIVLTLAAYVFPVLWVWPESLVFDLSKPMDETVESLITNHAAAIGSIKNTLVFYVLLPIKIGLLKAVLPFTWGFSLTTTHIVVYWSAVVLLTLATGYFRSIQLATGLLFAGGILFYGVTGLPFPIVFAAITLVAWQLGGIRLAFLSFCGMLFILLTDMWEPAMLSVYLCGVAVFICIIFGGLLGVLAANSDRVSAIIRPINDTLQTLPQFVLLIPALMFFQVGEFTALFAIIAYSIVPMIRYTEQGLRSVPSTLIEAGISSGCTPWQLFWQVRAPYAFPQIMLGINQTTLFGLTMLVIAALVGTTGLGQQIYIALSAADAGIGLSAGAGIAFIAMIADRILRASAGAEI